MTDAPREDDTPQLLRVTAPTTTTSSDAAASAPPLEADVDEAEVLFLIADFLKRRSKCTKAADALIEELADHQLLRQTVNWQGAARPATYADFRLRHRDLAPNHLLGLLKGVSAPSPSPSARSRPVTPRGGVRALDAAAPKSLLLKSRLASQRLQLPGDARKALAKDIVGQLFALRSNLRTQKVVERVVHKYERLRAYTEAASVEELPRSVRDELLLAEGLVDKAAALAADVRALRQLLQLKQAQRAIDAKMRAMMETATRAGLFQSSARGGWNQGSLLPRRQVRSEATRALPPAFIYSRMRRLKTLCGHLQIRAFCLTYDKMGSVVITGADDRLVKIWSLATGDLLFTLRGHVGNITDLAVNSANTLLASSSDDKTVRVWELSTGAPVAVLLGHSNVVNAVRFHPTKNVVVTASNDGRCFCYTLPDISPRPASAEPETKLQTAQRLNAKKAFLLSLHPVFSLTPGALRQGVRSCKVLCLSFSRCGKYVITGSQDGVGRVWDVSIFSSSDAPVSTSQYQHEGELEINPGTVVPVEDRVDELLPVTVPVTPVPTVDAAQAEEDAGAPLLPLEQQSAPELHLQDPAAVAVEAAPAPQTEAELNGVQAPGVVPTAPLVALPAEQEPRQPTQLPQLPQNGAVPLADIPDVDIPSLPAKEPIALLQGHTGPITNIVYSHDGKLIATASIKDGTTRIWQWDKKHKKLHHKVLFADETDDDEHLASLYGVQTRKKPAAAVDTLNWTKDDRRLITLHSVKPESHAPDTVWKQRVRVWDPASGKLVLTLAAIDAEKKNGHTNAVFVMDVHPTDWRIIVTAGYDGRIFLWDISTGTMLKAFANLSPDSELVPMLDGGFIPNGNGFCFTDRIGRLLIFGTGSGEQYAATPVQQYFQSDYAALITDRNFNVLDRETQQIPSMMNPGPLVDIYQIEYPHQPPHLAQGGTPLTLNQYEENRRLRIQQATESEIKCRVHHAQDDKSECESFPSAVLKADSGINRRGDIGDMMPPGMLAPSSYRLNGAPVAISELRRRFSANARRGEGSRRRNNSASLEERDTSILNIEISSEDDHSDVVVETNDGFIMGDNQLDKFDRSVTYAELLEAKQQQLGTTRDNRVPDENGEVLIPCAFCHGGDDGGVLKLPGEGMGVHPLINGTQRLFVHDQCAIASPLCFNRGGRWYNVTKEIRRGRSLVCVQCKKRGATVGCTVPSCPKSYHWKCAIECGWSMNQMHFYCPSHESMRSAEERGNDQEGGESIDPVTKRFGHTFHRDWLQKLNLASMQSYVPQVGDYVTYFPQGHMVYMRVFHEREPLYASRFRRFFALKCRVVNVRYVFPTLEEYGICKSIKCEISLAVLAAPSAAVGSSAETEEESKTEEEPPADLSALFSSDASPFAAFTGVDGELRPIGDEVVSERFHFQFMYHPHDVSNFLVLDHVYENGVRGGWQVGERVEMPLVELDENGSEIAAGSTQGVIRGFLTKYADSDSGHRVLTPWECVEVDWEDTDLEDTNVSPWEIEPVAGSARRVEKQRVEFDRRECALFRSRNIRGGKRAVLLQELDTIRNLSISRDFLYPVDSSFLDYVLTVANPIDITKIQQRVRTGYYRQVEAFIADAQLLYINCETYNVPTSSIAQNSRSIYSALLSQVLRHFPSLLRGENWDPQGECRMFSYPPNDFVEGFPEDDNVDPADQFGGMAVVGSTDSTVASTPGATSSVGAAPTSSAERSPVRGTSVTHLHASPASRANRRSRSGSQEHHRADEEEEEAKENSDSGQRRPRSKSDEMKSVLSSLSKQMHSPARTPRSAARRAQESQPSPVRGTGTRARTSSGNSSGGGSPGQALKPRRQQPRIRAGAKSAAALSTVDGLVDLPGLLDMLTTPQRELFEQQCDDDLPQVLRDFHEALNQLDAYNVFASPVTEEEAPGYSSVIANPMDFGTMADKIDDEYQDFAEYFDDLFLTLSNAITFNTWVGFVGETVTELQAHFVKFLLDAVGGGKPNPAAVRKRKAPSQATASGSKRRQSAPAKAKSKAKSKAKAPASRRRRVISDEEDDEESEDSASDARSEEDEEEEEDDEEEEDNSSDEDASDESDWGGGSGKRKQNLRRGAATSKRQRR